MPRLVLVKGPGLDGLVQRVLDLLPEAVHLLLGGRGVQDAPPGQELLDGQDGRAGRLAAAPPGPDHLALDRAFDESPLPVMGCLDSYCQLHRTRP